MPIFNPSPAVQVVRLADGSQCLVIDDVLADPEAWVSWGEQQRHEMRSGARGKGTGYPGIQMPMPADAIRRSTDFFLQHIRAKMDARRLVSGFWGMSMVTVQPLALHPSQWICHRDYIPRLVAGNALTASVLYLFKDPGLGGTSFYRPTQGAQQTARIVADSLELAPAAFTEKYGIEAGYMAGSNAWFEQIGRIEAKWNRIVFYDADIFHCGDLPAPQRLNADPRSGRLTLNGFVLCTRRAGQGN
ncbi:MAG: DUF6445 family protein [Pseudomonadota bacterium]